MQFGFEIFTHAAKAAVESGIKSAGMMGHTYVGSEHLLLGISGTEQSVGAKLLRSRGILTADIIKFIEEIIGTGVPTALSQNHLTPRAEIILDNSVKLMADKGCTCVGTDHLLLSILNCGDNFARKLLKELNVNIAGLAAELEGYRTNLNDNQSKPSVKAQTQSGIDKYATNLTRLAQKGEIQPLIGRNQELAKLIRALCRKQKNNPCLIGDPGVGKTAIVEGLAKLIADGEAPLPLAGKQIYSLDLTSLVAGTKYRGDFEERVQKLVKEVSESPDVILFIDEVHTVVGAGSADGSVDAANMLKPALTKGKFRVIGATTYTEYRKSIEKDSALERRFQPIYISEPTPYETEEIIKGIKNIYENHHGVTITNEAIKAAVNYSVRYINDRFLPDKAIDLIDEAAAKLCLAPNEKSNIKEYEYSAAASRSALEVKTSSLYETANIAAAENTPELSEYHIKQIVSENCKLPMSQLVPENEYNDPESELLKTVVGQKEAVQKVCRALRRSAAGVREKNRPIGSFLFCGPTGVGKTYLCRCIAKQIFGSEKNMIKLDMSEYAEKHSVSRLIGSPPGYVGYEEGGLLIEQVRKMPYSVVVFDEIEKAHPDIYNILLQILDEGILTDSMGRKANFTNTVVVLTSNYGTNAASAIGFNTDGEINSKEIKSISQLFRPELIGRIDEKIIFNKLSENDMAQIARLSLKELAMRIKENGTNLKAESSVFELLAGACQKTGYGARQMKKIIRDKIEDPLSELILNSGANGNFAISVQNGQIKVERAE